MNTDDLTLGQLKALGLTGGNRRASEPLPFAVGDTILIRTVTMYQVGKVRSIGRDFLVLEGGGWVADIGRFGEALAKGTLNEFEKAPDWMYVNRGAICDVFPWKHPIPASTK